MLINTEMVSRYIYLNHRFSKILFLTEALSIRNIRSQIKVGRPKLGLGNWRSSTKVSITRLEVPSGALQPPYLEKYNASFQIPNSTLSNQVPAAERCRLGNGAIVTVTGAARIKKIYF